MSIVTVSDARAMEIGPRLAREGVLLSGISSGAAVAAAVAVGCRDGMADHRLVVILASFDERCLSTPTFSETPPLASNPVALP